MRNNQYAVLMLVLLFVTACSAPALPTGEMLIEPSADVDPAATASPAAGEEISEAPPEAGTDLDMLTNHLWQWVSFSSPEATFDVDTPARYTLTFGEDGIVEIVADCNTAIASYGIFGADDSSLSMDVAPAARTTARLTRAASSS